MERRRLAGRMPVHKTMPAKPQGKWVVSELVSGFILALKGRDIPAQGNALGSDPPIRKALKGRDIPAQGNAP